MIGAASHVTNCGEPTLFASMSTTTNDRASAGSSSSEGRAAPHGPDAEQQDDRHARPPSPAS